MGRRKSSGLVYKRNAAETQNTVNTISNVCQFGTAKNLNLYLNL